MSDIAYAGRNKRIFFDWVPGIYFTPRRVFQKLSTFHISIWLTPLIILSCLVVANVLMAGYLKTQAAMSGEISYPPDFQYYTPEQQAQYMQAIQSTQGPVFMYVLPAISSLLGVWVGWLILGGILHLITTLFGGRGSMALSMNIVAWGSMPFALRSLVQIIFMLATHKLITNPGLSGFSPTGDSAGLLFLSQVLRLLDIYIIWQVMLLALGIQISTALNTTKSAIAVLLAVVIILMLKSGLAYAAGLLSNLSITRPFFF
jgi:hypothetical protein